MSPWEEGVLFTHEVGELIMGWSTVENDLCTIARAFNNGGPAFTQAFFAIDNLRAKLSFTDAMVRNATQDVDLLDKWKKLHDRIGRVARGRNKVAHYPSRCYTNYPRIGRRWALVPWDAPPMDESAGPPEGSICLRDLAIINHQLGALCGATQNFLWFVHGMRQKHRTTRKTRRSRLRFEQCAIACELCWGCRVFQIDLQGASLATAGLADRCD